MTTKTRRALVLPPKDPDIRPKFIPQMRVLIGQVIEVRRHSDPNIWRGADWKWHKDWLKFLDEEDDTDDYED